jgi:hypothetical protein
MTKEERAADDARIKKRQEEEAKAEKEVVLREEKVIKRGNGINQDANDPMSIDKVSGRA